MILADKIIEERKKNGWSQEELADKLGVSRQAVSKWESAGAVPDLQRIISLAEIFGVSTDYLLIDDAPHTAATAPVISAEPACEIRRVSMEEASEFMNMKKRLAPVYANATSMCIISPCLLIIMACLSEGSRLSLSEPVSMAAGLLFLFGMIAAAVFMFITSGLKDSRMEYLEKEAIETEYGVTGAAKARRDEFEQTYSRGLASGVALCILSPVPLVLAGIASATDSVLGFLVALLLLTVAAGVNIIIRVSTVRSSFDVLLQEGEFTGEEKKLKKRMDPLGGIYWCIVTAIYLGWSFYTNDWHRTWIIWPVAGVLYAAIAGFVRILGSRDE